MKPRLRAPLTAHLRKRLRPTSETQKAARPKKIKRGLFADDDFYEWVKITPSISKDLRVLELPESRDEDSPYILTDREKKLCRVLEMVADEHEKQKHSFTAMAAKMAIRLVRKGKEAEINPGLYYHVKKMEHLLPNT